MLSFLNSLRINFLYIDKYTFSNTWAYPESVIPYGILRYILQGSAVFQIDQEEIIVQQGEVVYIPEGSRLMCKALENEFTFISIRFNLSVHLGDSDILSSYYGICPVTSCKENSEEVRGYFLEILRCVHENTPGKIFRIHGNLELILAFLSEQSTNAPYQEEIPPFNTYDPERIKQRAIQSNLKQDIRIQSVIDYIILNPTENLQPETLCHIANMSITSLRRSFKQHTGKTLGEFIKDLRMMVAARRIIITNERISSIAYELGFEDPNYFSRLFKSVFGLSPQQYRKIAHK